MNMQAGFRVVAFICLWPAHLLAGETIVAAADLSELANPLARQPLTSLSATRARPLFISTRRMPSHELVAVVQTEAPPPPPPSAPSVSLLGILKENEEIRAIVRMGSAPKVISLRVGDDVGGWNVAEIAPRQMTLARGEQRVALSLYDNRQPKPLNRNETNVARNHQQARH